MYIPDNYDYYEAMEYEREMKLARMPVCECCGEHIQTELAFYYSGLWFCTDRECEKELIEMVWDDIKEDYLVTVEGE